MARWLQDQVGVAELEMILRTLNPLAAAPTLGLRAVVAPAASSDARIR